MCVYETHKLDVVIVVVVHTLEFESQPPQWVILGITQRARFCSVVTKWPYGMACQW